MFSTLKINESLQATMSSVILPMAIKVLASRLWATTVIGGLSSLLSPDFLLLFSTCDLLHI